MSAFPGWAKTSRAAVEHGDQGRMERHAAQWQTLDGRFAVTKGAKHALWTGWQIGSGDVVALGGLRDVKDAIEQTYR